MKLTVLPMKTAHFYKKRLCFKCKRDFYERECNREILFYCLIFRLLYCV